MGYKLVAVSMVDASMIKSQWQANFMQIFPVNYDNLPSTLSSDKQFFKEYWEGDNYTTYEQFIGKNNV